MNDTVPEDERFLSVADLAARYQVSEPTVHQWLYKRTAPRSLKIGRYRRFRLSDVLAWEAEQADAKPAV
jgi:predicted DNA-binding transcriptional regulator AlpA